MRLVCLLIATIVLAAGLSAQSGQATGAPAAPIKEARAAHGKDVATDAAKARYGQDWRERVTHSARS